MNKEVIVESIDAKAYLNALIALKNGDFAVRLPNDLEGISGKIADTFNEIAELCEHASGEFVRVGRLAGKEGRIDERVNLPGMRGGWAKWVEASNQVIDDLVSPMNEVSRVIRAVANGDLTQRAPIETDGRKLRGQFLKSAQMVNGMVEQLGFFATEVTRVARQVGAEGKLGVQAQVPGVAGTWKDLTDSVNMMAANLTGQVRNIAEVTTAVANGDLSKKITVDVKGEIFELKQTINTMVDQLNGFAAEVTRVAREVGTEGKLGGQAQVPGVAGTWKDLTDNVNSMAANLTNQVRNIADVTTAVANGDLSKKITVDVQGEIRELKDTINTMVDQLRGFASEVTRVAREVGTEGKLGGQAQVPGVAGTWKDLTDNVNSMAANLTAQVRNIAEVTTAVATGDLSRKITVDVKGEILELKQTINTMVDQLRGFASEVTRVAREVGAEGKLGVQAQVPGVAGTWKDLTDSVNMMAANLTDQVRNIAEVTTAVATGDLSRKITVDVRGEILELKETINTMVDQLRGFASEVTRVAREVGAEGKLGGQARVPGVAGTWKDLTDSVNMMAANLTDQVRNIAEVTTAVATGDLSKKITVDVQGEILELKQTINTMVDQLRGFASEVTRVAREVGTEGKLGGQAQVPGVGGTWKDLTDSVNMMAANLTGQVRNIAEVTTAVATGDLSKKITVDVRGEILELKQTINTMVDQLNGFAAEVTRVAREVGTEGKLGGQAQVPGVAGTWKDLTDSVNMMANNLTGQVRNIAEVTTAVANGDLSKKITVDVRGEILELKQTINTMVDQLRGFASEVTRVAREVGTEGKLGGQAQVPDVAGTWKDLTDNVNSMAANLTSQVRNIADVTTAVATGDLSKKITVDVQGEILELKQTINTMVDQLRGFASEVTRVAREVGTEGKLGGQAQVPGVAGTWKDLTDNVNSMAANLTAQVRNIADVTTAVATGDLSKKITVDVRGEFLQLKETINTMVDQLRAFASEVTRVAREVGIEGRLGGQAFVTGVAGTWKDLTDSVNMMASNLTSQVRNIATVTTAVATGDLSKKITVDVRGEILELKETINTMVDQLRAFASEVTRVAREVGTEGKLGGQADVRGVSGTWKDLTDSVNMMASNLTAQVRGIAKVVTAVANGDLKRRLTVEAKGEIADLSETINSMTETLALFADQVIVVAREVGVEGKLGGQANVPGAAGMWKDLVENVNQLAANLTTQVRAIADVATSVTNGDLSRSIQVEARGEVSQLKDNINAMIRNLRETTRQNAEQDWLKTNLAKFTRLLQGQRDLMAVGRTVLAEVAPLVVAQHGVFYLMDDRKPESPKLRFLAGYAFKERKNLSKEWAIGEGLVGECAYEKQRILLSNVPADYVQITSGLGEAPPLNIIVLPIIFEGTVRAVVELASFERFSTIHLTFLDQLAESIGIVLNTIEANMRTEGLLKQSQTMATELQTQQEELRQTNEELEEKARMLEEQKREVERKNREVELAKSALEDKANQLALTSKYKSQFLSNMSHELRTPLNSLLILSEQLAANINANLSEKQVEYARTIHASGRDLLNLINEILDLSKIESGTVALEMTDVRLTDVLLQVERTFQPVAENKGIRFAIQSGGNLPVSIITDEQRLHQVLKNLLSNAFKFTEKGEVKLRVDRATGGWDPHNAILNQAEAVVVFAVSDTGIGIPPDKQNIIFEAFQQVDAGTSRKYGGTGLGLAISREIAQLLNGELRLVHSALNEGSTFVFFLPLDNRGKGIIDKKPRLKPELEFQDTSAKTIDIEATQLLSDPVIESLKLPAVKDDRHEIKKEDTVLLIVEDDINFAKVLLEVAREQGFKGIIVTRGSDVINMVRQYQPHAITLDLVLPDISGWSILEQLKKNPETRHIPVDVISIEENRIRSLRQGAFRHLVKSVSRGDIEEGLRSVKQYSARTSKYLLVINGPEESRKNIVELLAAANVQIDTALNPQEVISAFEKQPYDCLVLNLNLQDPATPEILDSLTHNESLLNIPIIIFSEIELSEPLKRQIQVISSTRVLKAVKSFESLLNEAATFLHLPAKQLTADKLAMVEKASYSEDILEHKRVLIVDDDIRNVFALTSLLERYNMQVQSVENGKSAIQLLNEQPDLDIVLMDVMMPEMDGYETMRQIRKKERFRSLPIIALTAKAMKGDREKCLEAGASDYVSKPVDTKRLLSLMRVWLTQ